MRALFASFILSFSCICFAQENNFRLTVNFSEEINDSVFLSINKKTYRAFVQGKTVVFDAHVIEASKAWLTMKKSKCLIPFYADPGNIEITAAYFDNENQPCFNKRKIEGSKTEEAFANFEKEQRNIEKKFINTTANKRLERLSNEMIEKYSHSQVSIDVIQRVHKDLGREWTESALKMIDDSISGPIESYFMRRFLSAEYLQKGNYIDFTRNTLDGNSFTLSSLKGKYVLLDFWASWCGPCRKENPRLKTLYAKYKDKGLEIVGVSLDDNRDKWEEAVEKDGLPWIHISDLKDRKNAIANTLGIEAIPTSVLLDPQGMIVGINLRGNELEKTIEKLFNNKD